MVFFNYSKFGGGGGGGVCSIPEVESSYIAEYWLAQPELVHVYWYLY